MTNTPQLAIFICEEDTGLCISEKILDKKPMHMTNTGRDIFENVCQSSNDIKLSGKIWNLWQMDHKRCAVGKKWISGKDVVKYEWGELHWWVDSECDVEIAPVHIQIELIELLCNGTLRDKYDNVGPAQFPCFIPDTMPKLCLMHGLALCMFGSTYVWATVLFGEDS